MKAYFNKRGIQRLAVVGILPLIAYVGSYALLYRRGVNEAEALGTSYYFYVPVADVAEARDLPWQHCILQPIYAPINELHRDWFGGRSACVGITFGLSS